MDPSEEKKQDTLPPTTKKSNFVPFLLVILLLFTIAGISFYFYSGSQLPQSTDRVADASLGSETPEITEREIEEALPKPEATPPLIIETEPSLVADNATQLLDSDPENDLSKKTTAEENGETLPLSPGFNQLPSATSTPAIKKISICDEPAKQLENFYSHLDTQPYMANFTLATSSEKHFTALIHELLANPPQVTRESDDLYTILKNTAHFFRISGKDNILMLKGILDNEKSSVEQILGNYYQLVTTPECSTTPFASDIDHDALYEYACFFLNTMGGRLYLFRRDALSRMVVTYYAVLLVEQANLQKNNRHGIALRPVVDMLISEMEAGGSALKQSDSYLDTLYRLKEKYQ